MRLKTRLKIIRWRERYLDAWESVMDRFLNSRLLHRCDGYGGDIRFGHRILGFYNDLLWMILCLLKPYHLLNRRNGQSPRVVRVNGMSRTTTRPIRPKCRLSHAPLKWKDRPAFQAGGLAVIDGLQKGEFTNPFSGEKTSA